MNDLYTCASGGTIYAGLRYAPLWVMNQPDSTWGIVPAGNTIASIDAENDPNLNPNYPAASPWRGQSGIQEIIESWCGWHADTTRNWLHSIYNGGHGDYGGNEHIYLDLNREVPLYIVIRQPSGSKNAQYPNGFIVDDGQESTGVYADGQPRSIHSYNKPVFVPSEGLVIAVQGNTFSQLGGRPATIITDPVTSEVKYFGGTYIHAGAGTSGMGACYDHTRHCLWAKAVGTSRFAKFDLTTKVWTSVGSVSITNTSPGTGLEYIEDGDFLFCVRQNGAYYAVNCTTGVWQMLTITGDTTGLSTTGQLQPRYIGNRMICCWDNNAETTKIYVFTWVGEDPLTATWTVTALPVAPENAVTPSVAQPRGTYGRFAWWPKLRIFTVNNATNQPVYFYKLGA